VLHVRPDKVTGLKGTAERQFTCQHRGSDDACKSSGIVARVCWVWSSDTEHVEHCALGL
jgi:hypothetical protein